MCKLAVVAVDNWLQDNAVIIISILSFFLHGKKNFVKIITTLCLAIELIDINL